MANLEDFFTKACIMLPEILASLSLPPPWRARKLSNSGLL
jgi:hypothetical protein